MPLRCASLLTGIRLAQNPRAQWPAARTSQQHLAAARDHRLRRPFHTTSPLRDDKADIDRATNHYETLKIAPGSTPAEIKKSFYNLSKTHHPDHNRSDPSASTRFMRISEAYDTLSKPEKRSRYDRDVLGLSRSGSSSSPPGSYSSSNPAGGRAATGLSRRRSAFRGPPPSFYRQGGWGAHGAKRGAAHDESTGGAASGGAGTRDHHNDGHWAGGNAAGFGAGGMGPGQDPFGHREDVPHFDREGHERTGRRTEEHRTRSWHTRMGGGGERVDVERDGGATGMFFVISGVLMLSFLGPLIWSRAWNSNKTKTNRSPARP
ncbi:hypothetical protein TruAng_003926 [Truncatella angustata]|nr:hypothetical protein TruAng_003926 [Truncatella angustata]